MVADLIAHDRGEKSGLQSFINNRHAYAESRNRYLAATAAHITHMLRDMAEDLLEGYVNVPNEWLEDHGLGSEAGHVGLSIVHDPEFRARVQGQVELACLYFQEGKNYLPSVAYVSKSFALAYWPVWFSYLHKAQ